jgi:hypothetical protein
MFASKEMLVSTLNLRLLNFQCFQNLKLFTLRLIAVHVSKTEAAMAAVVEAVVAVVAMVAAVEIAVAEATVVAAEAAEATVAVAEAAVDTEAADAVAVAVATVAVVEAVAVAEAVAIVAVVATMTVAVDAVVAEAIVVVAAAAMIQGQMIEDPAVHRRATEAKPVVRRTNLPRTRRKAMERAKPTGITGLLRADSSVRVEAND